MTNKDRVRWQRYEEVACYVLQQIRDRLGLETVEGKQKVVGDSGTQWELDGKGIVTATGNSVIIECRRYQKRLSQEAVGAVAFRIIDLGSEGGIIVSPMPLQKGGKTVAAARNIQHVELTESSTTDDWMARINGILHAGAAIRDSAVMRMSFSVEVRDEHGNLINRISGQDDL